jgi:hypothetical protein
MPHWRALYNCGRRAPVSRGRLYAPADILAMVDVDAQDPPKELIRLTTQFDTLRTKLRLCFVCSGRLATCR